MFFRMVYKSGQIFLPFCHNPRVWRTDRRTDRNLLAIPRLHYMQRGKNWPWMEGRLSSLLCHISSVLAPYVKVRSGPQLKQITYFWFYVIVTFSTYFLHFAVIAQCIFFYNSHLSWIFNTGYEILQVRLWS